jgi:hypothetical protein
MIPDSALSPDAALLALRPAVAIQLFDESGATGDFMHRTLRPVLKLQNELLLTLVADFLLEHHVAFLSRAPAEQQRTVAELLARNVKLRYTVIGCIIGLFTGSERAFYQQHRSEVNRRVLELAIQRVQSQLPLLTGHLASQGRA